MALGYKIGRKLGEGKGRIAYATSDPRVAIKKDKQGGRANLLEACIWRNAPASLRSVLAPVIAVSDGGEWLAMRRATRYRGPEPHGHKWLKDRKSCNWGWIDGRLFLIDYAHQEVAAFAGLRCRA